MKPTAFQSSALVCLCCFLLAAPTANAGNRQEPNPGGTLVTPRHSHTATRLADGRVLLAGGGTNVSPYLISQSELYDPATNNWTATGSLNTARYIHAAVLLPDGRALVMGGWTFGIVALNSAEIYEPGTGQWTSTANMHSARVLFDPVVLPNGKVLVAGGINGSGNELVDCELYDPLNRTWTPTGSLLQPRSNYHTTLIADGKVLLAGGFSHSIMTNDTETYDPATGTWSNSGTISAPRIENVQVRLVDGRVLIAGGKFWDGSRYKYVRAVELYDPATGFWTRTGNMMVPRTQFTANLLANGRVFVIGGVDYRTEDLASSEEYDPSSGAWRMSKASLATA